MLAKIIACQPAAPGTAQLMVRLRGEQAVLPALTFTLCNNVQHYLQPDGSWSPAPHWFTVDGGYPLASGSGFRLDETLLDPLLRNASQVQIQVRLASGEERSTTLQLARDELFPSEARGQTAQFGSSSVLKTPHPTSAPTTETEQPPVPLPTPPNPHPAADKPRASGVPLLAIVAAAVLALLLIGGGLWWFLGRDSAAPVSAEPAQQATAADAAPTAADAPATPAAPETPATPATPAAAETPATPAATPAPAGTASTPAAAAANGCTPANLSSQSELDFVQSCVQQKLDSAQLLAIIQAAKQAKKCGVAQRLYANRAQSGDSQVAIAYAAEYDPATHQPNACFTTADKDTAAYWYDTALQTDPNNQQAKQRLQELQK